MPGGNCKFCSEISTKTFDNFDYGTEEESAELAQQGRILPEYPSGAFPRVQKQMLQTIVKKAAGEPLLPVQTKTLAPALAPYEAFFRERLDASVLCFPLPAF